MFRSTMATLKSISHELQIEKVESVNTQLRPDEDGVWLLRYSDTKATKI